MLSHCSHVTTQHLSVWVWPVGCSTLAVHHTSLHWERRAVLRTSPERNQLLFTSYGTSSTSSSTLFSSHSLCLCFYCAWGSFLSSAFSPIPPQSFAIPFCYTAYSKPLTSHNHLLWSVPLPPLVSITLSCLEPELGTSPENRKHSMGTTANKVQ